MRVLIVDSNIDQPWELCADFRRYVNAPLVVRRAPQQDLPASPRGYSHVILSGSKTSILDSSPWVLRLMEFVRQTADAGIPLLGVCYGHQIIARVHGAEKAVRRSSTPEVGWVEIRQTRENPLLKGVPEKFHSFQAHVEEVCQVPSGFVATAESDRCAIQAYYAQGKPIYGVQFHPERNAEEGQRSIEKRRGTLPKDCIFNDGKAKSVFTEKVADVIFRNFLSQ